MILGLPIVDAELALPESLLIAPATWAGAIILVQHPPRRSAPARPRRIPRLAARCAGCSWRQRSRTSRPRSRRRRRSSSRCCSLRGCCAATPSSSSATVVAITLTWLDRGDHHGGTRQGVPSRLPASTSTTRRQALPSSAVGGATHFALALAVTLAIAAGAIVNRNRAAGRLGARALGGCDARRHRGGRAAVSTLPRTGRGAAHPPGRGNPVCRQRRGSVRETGARSIGPGLQAGRPRGRDPDGEGGRASTGCRFQPIGRAARTRSASTTAAPSGGLRPDLARPTWLDDFDYRVDGDAKVAAWIVAEGFSGDTAVVWSYDAWVYALANLQIDHADSADLQRRGPARHRRTGGAVRGQRSNRC